MNRKMGGVAWQPIAVRSGMRARPRQVSRLVRETKPQDSLLAGECLQILLALLINRALIGADCVGPPLPPPAGGALGCRRWSAGRVGARGLAGNRAGAEGLRRGGFPGVLLLLPFSADQPTYLQPLDQGFALLPSPRGSG